MEAHPVVDIACPPRSDMLRLIRRIVVEASREAGFAADEASQIEISVDEACTNVIRHAYSHAKPGRRQNASIRLRVDLAPDRLAIRVADTGGGLAVAGASGVRSLEEYLAQASPRGLGSFIIDRFMDEVHYDTSAGQGTVLSMVKYRSPQSKR